MGKTVRQSHGKITAAAQTPVACPTPAGTLFVDGIIRDTNGVLEEAWLF